MSLATTFRERPGSTEHDPYYSRYIDQVPEGDVLDTLGWQMGDTLVFIRGLPEAAGSSRYAPGKWSVKEVLGHMADTERIFAYRALRVARGDRTPLPGFEQDDYVREGRFDRRPLAALASEFESVRNATLSLFRSLDDEALLRRGVANKVEITPRALAYIIAGHERHHLEILRTRYV
jgi:uncharacterized damage-inducible protein DinB